MSQKTLSYIFLGLICVGLADSFYLAVTTYLGVAPVCGVLHGCETVTRSVYSKMLGLPLAYLAVVYYVVGALLGGYMADFRAARLGAVLFGLLGVLMGIWSVYVQAVLLKAYCPYCLTLDCIALALTVVALFAYYKNTSLVTQK